jgi:hypothetical protein
MSPAATSNAGPRGIRRRCGGRECTRTMIDRQMLAAKAEELDGTIRELSAMRDGLRHAAACPAPSHMECPTFHRILRAAASGAIGARRKRRAPQPP